MCTMKTATGGPLTEGEDDPNMAHALRRVTIKDAAADPSWQDRDDLWGDEPTAVDGARTMAEMISDEERRSRVAVSETRPR